MGRKSLSRHRPDDVERPEFEFCVAGRPLSAQGRNRVLLQQWKAKVAEAALAAWGTSRPLLLRPVVLRVAYYSERKAVDMGNLVKPVQDALQGVVHANDSQVRDVTSNWRNIDGMFTVRHMALPLASAFSDGNRFLHIGIWISPDIEDLG